MGTRSLFGEQLKFDLTKGFPAVTTKRLWFRGAKEEILWMLRGDTNVKTLPSDVQKWWKPWADTEGALGPTYGHQFRKARWFFPRSTLMFGHPGTPVYKEGLTFGVGELGNTKKTWCNDEDDAILKDCWRDMLRRCYHTVSKAYPTYGGRGIHVCNEWLYYPNFKRDAMRLPGWLNKKTFPRCYSLDKDIRFTTNRYGPETCMWAGEAEQSYNRQNSKPFTCVNPEGNVVHFASIGQAQREASLSTSAVYRCLTKKLHTHHGWRDFKYMDTGVDWSFREVDQIRELIAGLIHNPFSRRHIIALWDTSAMTFTGLPCCHGNLIQFYVSTERELSCHMYQRSCDFFIGGPVNIAQYAIITRALADLCGMLPKELTVSYGDVHIYSNHADQCKTQLSRKPFKLPQLLQKGNPINEISVSNLLTIIEGYELINYKHHPFIKAPIAV